MAQGQVPWLKDVTRNECRSFYLLSETETRTWVEKRREEKVWGWKGQTVWNNFYRCFKEVSAFCHYSPLYFKEENSKRTSDRIQGKPPLMRHKKEYRAWRQDNVGERTQWNLLLLLHPPVKVSISFGIMTEQKVQSHKQGYYIKLLNFVWLYIYIYTHIHTYTYMRAKVLQSCSALCNTMECIPQAPLSMGFSRQEYCSGLVCPPPGDLPGPGIKSMSPMSLAFAGRFFTTSATWDAHIYIYIYTHKQIHMAWQMGS